MLLKCSVQFSSVSQSCPILREPMNCSTPGLPVHHQLPEFTQSHVHRISDAIQPSHPYSSQHINFSPPWSGFCLCVYWLVSMLVYNYVFTIKISQITVVLFFPPACLMASQMDSELLKLFLTWILSSSLTWRWKSA